MKMKEVIMLTGIPERTIRFYEERGMLQVPTERRNGRTYHEFTQENVEELKRIVILRKARFSLDEIQEMRKHPEKIGSIVTANFSRLEEEQKEIQHLTQDEGLKEARDWGALSDMVQQSLRAIPGYEASLRFGKMDVESEEEKQAAIAAYRRNTRTRDNILLFVFMGLAAFFLCMAVLFGALLYGASRSEPTAAAVEVHTTVPEPSGNTQGWIYYRLEKSIARAKEDGTGEEIIYQSTTENSVLQFLMGEDKLYILDDAQLFSVNADGTGLYEYPAEILPEYSNSGGSSWLWEIFLLYGDSLFVIQQDSPYEKALVRVPVDGGKQEELDIDLSHLSNICGWIWDDMLYVYGVEISTENTDEDGTQFKTRFTSVVSTYNLTHDNLVETRSGTFVTESAMGLYFSRDAGYLLNTNEVVEGQKDLIRVTPENPDGEIVKSYTDEIWTMYEKYLLLATVVDGFVMNFYLENVETGARTDLGENLPTYLDFTPVGLRVAPGEFVEYP